MQLVFVRPINSVLLPVIALSLFIASFKGVKSSYLRDYNHSKFPNKLMPSYNLHGATLEATTASLELGACSLLLPINHKQVHVPVDACTQQEWGLASYCALCRFRS
jgi:hypothetical protein